MPLYEYQCLTCGKKTEWLQSLSDPPLAACPTCGNEVKKLVSSPAFQFKGTGWYVTDYAGKKGAGAESGGGGDGGGSEAKSDKSEKSEKPDKAEKSEKSEKSEKAESSSAKPAESKPSTPAPAAPKASSD